MKSINLLLEEDEILLLRGQIRMIQIMLPETNEQIESYAKKILDATNDISEDSRKEIGKMQRAMRRVKETFQYAEFMSSYQVLEKILIREIEKEEKQADGLVPPPADFIPTPIDGFVGDFLVGVNYDRPIIEVKHADLKRLDSDSPHKSICPVCEEGALLMDRHPSTMFLSNKDRCVFCAQLFMYTDIPNNEIRFLK